LIWTKTDECGLAWISGIYKIRFYEFTGNKLERRKHYHAFYVAKGQKNWGDFVDPEEFKSLREAKAACERHLINGRSEG